MFPKHHLAPSFFKNIFLLCGFYFYCNLLHAQVLTEKITDVGFGFKQIQHTQVNVAGRWKSDVKFHFLYHQKRRLCQCTFYAISTSGRYAIFQEMATKENFIFHVNTEERIAIPKTPLGILKEVTWNKNETRAQLFFQEKDVESMKSIFVKVKTRHSKIK